MSYYDQPVHLDDDDDPSKLTAVHFVDAPPDHDFAELVERARDFAEFVGADFDETLRLFQQKLIGNDEPLKHFSP